MTAAGKIQRASHVGDKKAGGKRRLDGKVPPPKVEIPCAYAKCRQPFAPAKHNQVYCSDDCRKRASFDRKFLRLDDDPNRILQLGDRVLVPALVIEVSGSEVRLSGWSTFLEGWQKKMLVIPAKDRA